MSAFLMNYKQELTKAMTWLGKQRNTIFVGQAVEYPGTFMYDTLKGVPEHKKLEIPVCESFQMQFCMGLAKAGYTPICIFPRQNFMLHALGDIINTLDKLDVGKVIVRVASGTTKPVYPGIQHCGDYKKQIADMLTKVPCFNVQSDKGALMAYQAAYRSLPDVPVIVIEHGDMY